MYLSKFPVFILEKHDLSALLNGSFETLSQVKCEEKSRSLRHSTYNEKRKKTYESTISPVFPLSLASFDSLFKIKVT